MPIQEMVPPTRPLYGKTESLFPALHAIGARELVESQVGEAAFHQMRSRQSPNLEIIRYHAGNLHLPHVAGEGNDRHLLPADEPGHIGPFRHEDRNQAVSAPVGRNHAVMGHRGVEHPSGFAGIADDPSMGLGIVVPQRHQHPPLWLRD